MGKGTGKGTFRARRTARISTSGDFRPRVQLAFPRRRTTAFERTEWLDNTEEEDMGIKELGKNLRTKDYYTISDIEDYDYDEAELKDVSSMADFANLRSKQKVLARYLPDDPESLFPAGYYAATVVHDKVRGEGLLFKARYNTLRLDFYRSVSASDLQRPTKHGRQRR